MENVTTFGQRMTIEEFKEANKCAKLFFNYATKKDAAGINQKLYYNDANGLPTNVQKIAVTDEAGKTVAWCSREVASEIAEGKSISSDSRGLAFVDVITPDGEVHPTLLHPSSNNRIEGLSF